MREVIYKSKISPPSRFDRALAAVAPGFALKRYRDKTKMQALGAYIPDRSKRAQSWKVTKGDFATDVLPELEALRENSEDLYRKNMLASSAINTETTSVIGPGLTAQPRLDAEFLGLTEEQASAWEAIAARRWLLFSESPHCTVNKKHNFRELQNLTLLSSLIRGDAFVITPESSPLPYFPFRLRLQLVEADRVCNADNAMDTETLSGGIETLPDGELYQAHIRTTHPGGINSWEQKWEKVPFFGERTGRRNILHFYKSIRGDQSRGVPVLATVMEGLKQFAELTQATLDAAVIQTFLSVFIETADGNGLDLPMGDSSTSTNESIKLGSASIIDLLPGEKATVINPTHPNANYATFATEFQKQIGAALNVPMEIITKYFQSSYTAAQGALLEAWRYFYMRRAYAVDNLCQPVYELFIAGEVASGELIAPGFFTDPEIRAAYCGADWVGPPRGHIREDVQNKADGYAENRGWKTSQQNTQERGNRIDRNTRQRISEIKARTDGGILTKDEDLIDKVEPIKEVIE